jgi:mRNA interferase RelE/StbE
LTYQVTLTGPAQRDLRSLPEGVAAAVIEFCMGPLAERPYQVGREMRPPLQGIWSARRGEYRVRYRIDDTVTVVEILRIHHRRDAYHR